MKKILIIKCGNTLPEIKEKYADFEQWIISLTNLPDRMFTVYNLPKGERLLHPSSYHAAFIIGVPDAYNQQNWVSLLKDWIVAARYSNIPVLGICTGAHIIAEVFGGNLMENKGGLLFGIDQVNITTHGMSDPLFKRIGNSFDSFHYHRMQIDHLPKDAEVIAFSNKRRVEAFKIGRMYGIQFRPEFTPEIMRDYILLDDEAQRRVRVKMKSGYKNQSIISNFLDLSLRF